MAYSSDIKKSKSDHLININSCGEMRVDEDSHIRRYEGRNDYQLIYVCEGQCVVTAGNNVRVAYAGDCILYKPGDTQDYLLPKHVNSRTYWIHFNGSICERVFNDLMLNDVLVVNTQQNHDVERLISRICRYYNLGISNREIICSGLMYSVLAFISNEAHRSGNSLDGSEGGKISELISRIKIVPNLDFSVSECAEFCNMSKAHFTRVFKKTVGATPIQFILKIRIERAKELLDFTDKSITDIAESSGFQDQNYFARIFKKQVGLSPTQYRKSEK